MANNHIFRNVSDGLPVAYGILPDDYRERTELSFFADGSGRRIYRYSGEIASPDGSIRIFFDSDKKYMEMRMDPAGSGGMPTDGTEVRQYCDLRTQMDEFASMITGGSPAFRQFHAFSAEMQQKLSSAFNTSYNKIYNTLSGLLHAQGDLVAMQMGEPFLDGGICEYSYGGKCLFIAMARCGYRTILADRFMGMQRADNISWNLPLLMYMVCDEGNAGTALGTFRTLAESFEKSRELSDYDEQLTNETVQRSNVMFQQNQQMINYAWQQQNARWDAVKRQRDILSRDLDSFRAGLNQSMQQNDAWHQSMFGSSAAGMDAYGESSDDRVQRLRHEATMGVNTYVNEDGHETEFTTQADRVFESKLDDLDHFGTEHYYGDYVPDGFKEIFRKK